MKNTYRFDYIPGYNATIMKHYLIGLVVLSVSMLSATIRLVDIDGTGQYTSIQDGINAAVNSDTVLVYPGLYLENIDYSGKSITIASLEMSTGHPAYRDSTIIDGHNSGTCVLTSGNSALFGFTIQHGSGWVNNVNLTIGGGVRMYNTPSFTLANCNIKDNMAFYGGGIYASVSTVYLKNLNIYNNKADLGGGAMFTRQGSVYFDEYQRCSIYSNYAGVGNDVFGQDLQNNIHLALDTLSIVNPNKYYVYLYHSIPSYTGYFTYDILQGYREEVNHDLYVSPDGNDDNSGLTPTEPLKTIAWALQKIAPDSLNPKTIYVNSGIYHTDDGQIFPLTMKDHVRLIGNEQQYPVIQNRQYWAFISCFDAHNIDIKNFEFDGSGDNQFYCFDFYSSTDVTFNNIFVYGVHNDNANSGMYYSRNIVWDNIHFDNITSQIQSIMGGQPDKISITNSSFNNCRTLDFQTFSLALQDSLYMSNVSITNCVVDSSAALIQLSNWGNNDSVMNLNNLLIANNSTSFIGTIILGSKFRESKFTNNTITNNTASGFSTEFAGLWDVKNNIFDNNAPSEINIPATYTFSTDVDFENNLIKNYPTSVIIQPPSVANFLQGNFDADPGFVGSDWSNPLSYRLDNDSPCIDAGTPDTTGLYLPEFDLIGNPRIYNNVVDIGCYEWNGTGVDDNVSILTDGIQLSLYPNPLYANGLKRSYSFIEFTLPKKAKEPPLVEIYNLKGQKVRSLTISQSYNDMVRKAGLSKEVNTSGEFYSTVFDCKDMNSRALATGIYIVRVNADGKQASVKMTIIR
jgi:hypothetical protein